MTRSELTEQILLALIKNSKIVSEKQLKDQQERDRLIKLAYNLSTEYYDAKETLSYTYPDRGFVK